MDDNTVHTSMQALAAIATTNICARRGDGEFDLFIKNKEVIRHEQVARASGKRQKTKESVELTSDV